jgi:hypothetical protein
VYQVLTIDCHVSEDPQGEYVPKALGEGRSRVRTVLVQLDDRTREPEQSILGLLHERRWLAIRTASRRSRLATS